MTENQNSPANQKTDSKSHLEQTQDGKKKEETNPNNPKANQANQQNSQEGKDSSSTTAETYTSVTEDEKEEVLVPVSSGKPGNQNTNMGK